MAEVLSDSTEETDRGEKMEVYAKVGIQEYWLIDWRLPGGKVERYMLNDDGNKYLLHDTVNGLVTEKINIISFPHWEFSMKDLMAHIGEEEITE